MDVAPRVDRLLAKAVNEQLSEQRLIRESLEDVAERLDGVEATAAALEEKIGPWSDPGGATADLAVRVEKRVAKRLDALETRLDALCDVIERRAVERVSGEMADVADELRKAVGELGRLLVRDRGRISSVLTEHRNAILAEIRLPDVDADSVDLRESEFEADGESDRPRVLRRLRGL